jgi:hypothetical protein
MLFEDIRAGVYKRLSRDQPSQWLPGHCDPQPSGGGEVMTEKTFDCVQMKHDIQARIMKEIEGLSLDERNRRFEARIAADPILGPFWKNAKPVPGQDDDVETSSEKSGEEGKVESGE